MKYKNIFILCTGRSGSSSFIEACKHITNYSSAHESLSTKLGNKRFDYPINHIEADNRLTWFLGSLGNKYSNDETLYIHLIRSKEETVASFDRRWDSPNSIVRAFSEGILKTPVAKLNNASRKQICIDYYDTINSNISYFLNDKPNTLKIDFEQIKTGFKEFWNTIDAEGNLEAATKEFDVQHNKSKRNQTHSFKYRLKLLLMKLK